MPRYRFKLVDSRRVADYGLHELIDDTIAQIEAIKLVRSLRADRPRESGMPRRFGLSARLSWIPVPGKCMTPIGNNSSMASLRLKGAALACFVQSGLKAIC
jgi:hypothetical protein